MADAARRFTTEPAGAITAAEEYFAVAAASEQTFQLTSTPFLPLDAVVTVNASTGSETLLVEAAGTTKGTYSVTSGGLVTLHGSYASAEAGARTLRIVYKVKPAAASVTPTVTNPENPFATTRVPTSDKPFSEFARLLAKQFADSEEVRYDVPASFASAFLYLGDAPAGTLTSAASWLVIRFTFDANGNPSRAQFRTGVAWDNRAVGWPA